MEAQPGENRLECRGGGESRQAFPPRRAWRGAVLALAAALWCGAAWAGAPAQMLDQSESNLETYKHVKSYVDRTPAELMAMIPDLKGLVPAAGGETDEKALAEILRRVRENVLQSCDEFPNTTSREDITMERVRDDGRVEMEQHQTFRYLVVAHKTAGVSTLEEYRTNMDGLRADPSGIEQGLVVTKGFASTLLYFHPAARLDSSFRLIGTQKLDGKQTDVIAFAQRPGWASSTIRVIVDGKSTTVYVQGLAWIDPATFQVLWIRTDMLAPLPNLGLSRETIEIEFGRVRFPEKPSIVLWLPQNVTVTARWRGDLTETRSEDPSGGNRAKKSVKQGYHTYYNVHHYSDFKLFGSESKLKF